MMDDEIGSVAALWHDTWHDSHDLIAEPALCTFRTADYLLRRIECERKNVHVAGAQGRPLGLCIVSGANLDMLFITASKRSNGIGECLLADAEKRMRESGVKVAYLYVALRNEGAIRFYRRHGWAGPENVDKEFEVAEGNITITVGKMIKAQSLR